MTDPHTASAVVAATSVARSLGLPAGSPQVLHERSNVLVRMGHVVARVPATTLLMRPDATAWLERDVALSAFLTERDVPVVSPTTDPPAGPHFAAGLPVTLWHWTPHDPDHRHSPGEVGDSLARVHSVLRGFPGELPVRGPFGELETMLRLHGDAMDGAADRIRAEAARIEAELPAAPVQALHGDAHPGNLIATAEGPCWLDFEDTWRGPLAWDLAILAKQGGPDLLAAYPAEVDEAAIAAYSRLRSLFAVGWRFLVAKRFPHRLGEARAALAGYFG